MRKFVNQELSLRIFVRKVWRVQIIIFLQKEISFCGEIEKRVSEIGSEVREFDKCL